MKCPHCDCELHSDFYEGYPVKRCPLCDGFWLEGQVLLGILKKRVEKMPAEVLAAVKSWRNRQMPKESIPNELVCPKCAIELNRSVYGYDSGLIIDRCDKCGGVWLDKGELVALQAFDEVWEQKSKEIYSKKGLGEQFAEMDEEEQMIEQDGRTGLRKTIIGRIADLMLDFLE